ADGGIDARVDGAPSANSILVGGQTFFQLKAGSSFKPWQNSQLKKELFGSSSATPSSAALGAATRECLDNEGRYVLVVFGHDLTPQQQSDAKKNLVNLLVTVGYASPVVEVIGQSQLMGLLVPYPSLCLEILGRADLQFQTVDAWKTNDDMRPDFKPGAARTQFIEDIRSVLFADCFQHLRVIGEPGIGKSRLILEAVSSENLAPTAIYLANGEDFQKSALFHELLRPDRSYVVTLVIDDCVERDRASIWRTFKGKVGIKLITIDHGPEESSGSSMKVFQCPPLEKDQVVEIIASYIGERNENSNWAEWCDGSPRVAHAVGDNLRRNPDDILKPPATVPIWDRFILGHHKRDEREAEEHLLTLRHIALFRRFGFEPPVDEEARFISALVQEANPSITWQRFQSIVLHHRKRRVLQGQRTLFIVPKALHVYIWLQFWEHHGRGFNFKSFLEKMPESLSKWFMELFIYAHGSSVATQVVKQILSLKDGPFSRHEFLISEAGTNFLSVLAEANPQGTLSLLEATIGTWSVEQLHRWTTGRQQIVWALEKIAVWEDTFPGAARLLMSMALAENTSYSNNSKGTFLSLFMLGEGWAPTQAPPELRFQILSELIKSPDQSLKELGLEACKSWMSTYGGMRMVGAEYQGLRPTIQFWRPKTYGEIWDSLLSTWNFLWFESQCWTDSSKDMAHTTLMESAPGLIQIPSIAGRILDTIYLMANNPVADKKKIAHFVIHQLKYREEHLPENIISRLGELDTLLTGTTFRERFNRYVIYTDWDEDHNFVNGEVIDNPVPVEKVQQLADEAAAHSEIIDDLLSLFVSVEGHRLCLFGYRLSFATNCSLIDRIIAAQEMATPQNMTQFIGGYLAGVKEQQRVVWEDSIRSVLQSESLRSIGVDLVFRTGASEMIVNELIQLYRDKKVPSHAFFRFGLFSGEDRLSRETIEHVLEALSENPDERALSLMVEIADHYFCENKEPIGTSKDLILRIITIDDYCKRTNQRMQGYNWQRIVNSFRKQFPDKDLELFEHIITRLDSSIRQTDYACRVADEIAKANPDSCWNIISKFLDKVKEEYSWYMLSWLGDEISFGEREKPGAIRYFTPQCVMEWIKEKPKKRVPLITRCLPKSFDLENGGELTRLFVEAYCDGGDASGRLISHFWCGGYSGPESMYRSNQREEARKWLSEINSPKIRAWLIKYIECLSETIERAQISEERAF
ncbi:MAG: hypothetical protein HY888_10720, partial [Deltaproteobacteria bacterium]|nr:hypothetical protein [Deltaproteobacteria bacterium]